MRLNPIQVQKYLEGIECPATKDRLIQHARENGAQEDILDLLGRIAEREYHGPNAISQELIGNGSKEHLTSATAGPGDLDDDDDDNDVV